MRLADLSLTVSQHKLACVLDPSLLLDHAQGPTLALRLTHVLEPWLTRSFWHVIDASELLRGARAGAPDPPDPAALAAWITLRDETDAGSWPLRWVGDNRAESQVRDGADADVVERYEWLSAALARRCPVPRDERARWTGIDRTANALDTLALSACLEGATVLTQMPGDGDPWPVRALMLARVPVQSLTPMPADTLFAAERQLLRGALAGAGLAALTARLPKLAVVHVSVEDDAIGAAGDGDDEALTAHDPWTQASAWWYPL
jgi:hypothetical protein